VHDVHAVLLTEILQSSCQKNSACNSGPYEPRLNMHRPYWPQRPYTAYTAVLYTKQGAVKLSQILMKSIGCHRKHIGCGTAHTSITV